MSCVSSSALAALEMTLCSHWMVIIRTELCGYVCVFVCERVWGAVQSLLAGLQPCSSCFSPQEKEMEKQRLLYQQSRLHNRGAAEMVLQMISACKGSCYTKGPLTHMHAHSHTFLSLLWTLYWLNYVTIAYPNCVTCIIYMLKNNKWCWCCTLPWGV